MCFACSEHSGRHGEHLAGLLPHATCRGEAKVSRERERGGGGGLAFVLVDINTTSSPSPTPLRTSELGDVLENYLECFVCCLLL